MIPSLRAAAQETDRKMPLKGHRGIKRHPKYNKVSWLLQYSFIQSPWGSQGINCVLAGDYHSRSLTEKKT